MCCRERLPNYKYIYLIHYDSLSIEKLLDEICVLLLQVNYDKALQERQHLIAENESLRSRLRDVVHSPLSDAEKQQIIDDSQHRLHSSAPASIAIPHVSDCDIEVDFSIWCRV